MNGWSRCSEWMTTWSDSKKHGLTNDPAERRMLEGWMVLVGRMVDGLKEVVGVLDITDEWLVNDLFKVEWWREWLLWGGFYSDWWLLSGSSVVTHGVASSNKSSCWSEILLQVQCTKSVDGQVCAQRESPALRGKTITYTAASAVLFTIRHL